MVQPSQPPQAGHPRNAPMWAVYTTLCRQAFIAVGTLAGGIYPSANWLQGPAVTIVEDSCARAHHTDQDLLQRESDAC